MKQSSLLSEILVDILSERYFLPDDYAQTHKGKFENIETSLEELVRLYNEVACKGFWEMQPEQGVEMTNKEFLRYALAQFGRDKELSKNIDGFLKGRPFGSIPECGAHQWYVPIFYPSMVKNVHPYVENLYKELDRFDSFDEIFELVTLDKKKEKEKDKFRGYGPTCIYDTILRMVYNRYGQDENHRLMPLRYVYLHSKPGKTLKLLNRKGLMNKAKYLIIYSDVTDSKYVLGRAFAKYHMTSIDIENFLCIMNKPIENLLIQ